MGKARKSEEYAKINLNFFGFSSIALIESLNASRGVHKFLFSCIKWVTVRTNFNLVITPGGIGLHDVAARAFYF